MAWEIYISEENLLGYTMWNKLGHDNSEMLNTFLSYYKWNRYWHEYIQPNRYWVTWANTLAYFRWNSATDVVNWITLSNNGTEQTNSRLFNSTIRLSQALDTTKFVSVWWNCVTAPAQSNQIQWPYCSTWWVVLDWQHTGSGKYDKFEYKTANSWVRWNELNLQWNTWYHLAFGADDTWLFYFINGVKTRLYTWSWYSTESTKHDLYLYIDSWITKDIYLWDTLYESESRSDAEIIDYFNRSKVLYWYT